MISKEVGHVFWRGEVVATRKSTDVLAFSRGLGWGPVGM